MRDWVLVDTCVWAPFFNRPQLRRTSRLAELLETDQAAIAGPILQEILVGIRRTEHARWVASQLDGLNWIDLERSDWIDSANLGRSLLQLGKSLPAADLQIAAMAMRLDCQLYSTDPHFDLIPGLRRFSP